ncbi:MAG: type II CAAX endopeptidase family protein [Chloroflexi bacterium]|nr:type II CAAX endopeptidase family protein [Chloroflexota bacterium]
MTLFLPGFAYGIILIIAASIDLRAKDDAPLSAAFSLGLTQLRAPWKLAETLVSRLSPCEEPTYSRHNPLHRAGALLLAGYLIWTGWRLLSLPGDTALEFFSPGLSGALLGLAASAFIYVSLAALGTGWLIRRDRRAVLRRLGLGMPTLPDWLAGFVFGALIFACMTVAAQMAPPSGIAERAGASTLFNILKNSLPAAFLVAILAGTGEEIFFRGALQPVFGLLISSLIFTATHVHYGPSPALLILLFVSLGFGLLRWRYNTTVAIIAHATYDFLPFLIYRMASG